MVYIHENRGARPNIRSLNVRLCIDDLFACGLLFVLKLGQERWAICDQPGK
jgi:hypothetical protein